MNYKRPVPWTDVTLVAFKKCKADIVNAATLTFHATNQQLSAMVDASDLAIGAVLHTTTSDGHKPLPFYSRKLSPSERKYSTIDIRHILGSKKVVADILSLPSARFDHVHLDLVGPLPPSDNCEYLLTCIDRFTQWPEAVPISNISAETIERAFISQWISRFGLPSIITTDQGRQFESNLFSLPSKLWGFQKIRTTPHYPSSNGIFKRFHRSLKQSPRCHASTKWTESIPVVLLGLRTALRVDLRYT
ncbi:hypothetical protein AVEN_191166-1 [Araneus ventricosus]|uniref:Integrase catalytic domain-containing protein n=1 Tax=Araneus ventricosus TaxID=182803 RepID=A0A4Y2B068_ARAVE|nr:hypothetical protein AVEN_191166-1 [Araneus ventricosus]